MCLCHMVKSLSTCLSFRSKRKRKNKNKNKKSVEEVEEGTGM